jgi:hypothetical protein
VRKGAGELAILSSGFGEPEDCKEAQRELARIGEVNDIAVCASCPDLLNFVGKSALAGRKCPAKG